MDALGLAPDDPRPISLTGGLPYHGGPSSNYMSHSISHLVDHLRAKGGTGLVTGVGMHMTKHVAGIWSTEPGALSAGNGGDEPQQWEAAPVEPDVVVVARGDGPANVLAATVVHHSDGTPSHVVAICELADGTRCYATSQDPAAIDVVVSGDWVERKGQVRDRGDGTNDLRW
jgi:acetyl-CoA C-acetyltransferase